MMSNPNQAGNMPRASEHEDPTEEPDSHSYKPQGGEHEASSADENGNDVGVAATA